MLPKTPLSNSKNGFFKRRQISSRREGRHNTVMTYWAVTDLDPNLPPLLDGTELDNSLVQFPQAQISVASPLSLKEMLGMSGLSW